MIKNTILFTCFCLLTSPLFAQLNIEHRSTVDYSPRLNDIWGYAADGNEYALVGLRTGVNILDITDPDNPINLGTATGPTSTWRDLKTFGEYAYVTNENEDGLLVIDLSNLPDTLTASDWSYWEPTIPGVGTITDCHNIYIDESGYGYLAGCNVNLGGPVYIDFFTTPGSPAYVDKGPAIYAHDIYTRSNIMYTSDIYDGKVRIYDVTDKTNTLSLGDQTTPFDFTHNAWPNDGDDVVFTTDEKANATTAAYDISDPTDIQLLDEFKPLATVNTGVIPHNVHVLDDYLVISHYSDGVVIVDASEPDNLIEVGNYDTYTGGSTGFNGAWGAYPFLPSGTLLVSDQNNGCFILTPTYVRAARLEGTVTDIANGDPLFDVDISISATQANEGKTDLVGNYKTGLAEAGTYDVTYSKAGYIPETVSVTLTNGIITIQDVQLGVTFLAIELIEFKAELLKEAAEVQLNWKALSDDPYIQFNIERSLDGIDFEVVGQLEDRQPSVVEKAYQHLDEGIPYGELFYRLAMIEPDGKVTYSPIRVVEHRSANDQQWLIFPNPIEEGQQLMIQAPSNQDKGDYTLEVYNSTGKLVDQVSLKAGEEQAIYDSSPLSAGVYLLKVASNDRTLQTERIIIK